MPRGMWSGIAAGFADIQERKRLEQDRQDKLELITQDRADKLADRAESLRRFNLERADRQVALGISLSEKYTAAGVTTGSGVSGKNTSGATLKAAQLKKMGMADNYIAELASGGGVAALDQAIALVEQSADPKRPFSAQDFALIAESIVVDPGYQATEEDVAAFFSANNIDPSGFNEAGLERIRKNISRPAAAASGLPALQRPPEMQDLAQAEKTFVGSINSALDALTAGSEDITLTSEVGQAKDYLAKGSPEKAITVLIDKYGQEGFKKLYESISSGYPEFYGPEANLPLGVVNSFKDVYNQISAGPTTTTPARRLPTRLNPETGKLEVVQ